MAAASTTADERFKEACKRLYEELLDPESPLFTKQVAHPSYPDTPEDRELTGAPTILVPLQNIMFSAVHWSSSWSSRFAEIGPLRELAQGPGHGAGIAAEHLEVYDAQQISISGRMRTVAFSDLARGARGSAACGRHARLLIRDIVIFQLVDLLRPTRLRGAALRNAVARYLEIALPDVELPANLRLLVQRMRDRLDNVTDELRFEDLLPDGQRDGSWEESEVLDDIEREMYERADIRPMTFFDPDQERRLPYDGEELPGEAEDETIGLLEGPYATWGNGVREMAENASVEVRGVIESALANDEPTWRPLVEGARAIGLETAGLVERLVAAVSWYPAVSSILRSDRFERPHWQELIDVAGPTAPYAQAVLELYCRWCLRIPGRGCTVWLVDLFDAFKAAGQGVSISTGLDSVAVLVIRDVLVEAIRPEQSWDLVDAMLRFARAPHREEQALRRNDDPLFQYDNRLSGLGTDSLRAYHQRGRRILEALEA